MLNTVRPRLFDGSDFLKITFQTFLGLFAIKKVCQRKTLFRSCEKFRNVILFADYIKFGPQTFDCYIYFVLNIFFIQFHPLEFDLYMNFDPYFYNCYLLFSYHFLIEIFYLPNLVFILLIVTYFI